MYFDGTEGYSLSSNPFSSYPISVACNARVTDGTAHQIFFSLGHASDNSTFLILRIVGGVVDIAYRDNADTPIRAFGTTSVPNNTWFHIAGSLDSSRYTEVFYNGNSEGSDNTTSTADDWSLLDRLGIGYQNRLTPGTYTTGDLTELGVWNVELTPGEFKALGNGVSPLLIRPESLVFYAPLLKGSQEIISATSLSNVGTPVESTGAKMGMRPSAQILRFPTAAAASFQAAWAINSNVVVQ